MRATRVAMPPGGRAGRGLPALLVVASSVGGCGYGVEGDFDGISFSPGPTMVAVADRNELLLQNGAVTSVSRVRDDQRLHLLFTGATVDTDTHWAHAPADALAELTRALATHDGLVIEELPLARFAAGEELVAVLEDGAARGDFSFAMGMTRPDTDEERAIGSRIRIVVKPRGLELSSRSGSVSADVTVVREREAGQDPDAATGRFTLRFSTALAPERLAEANIAVASAVLSCMQGAGPGGAAACAHAPAPPTVDETGRVP